MVIEQLSKDEQHLVMYAIRQFGTGGHPLPDEQNIVSFNLQYATQCLQRALKDSILSAPEREQIAGIVIKLCD